MVPGSKGSSGSDSNEGEGEGDIPREGKEGVRQTPRTGRKGLATGCAGPHADEWETREGPEELVTRPLSLSLPHTGDSDLLFLLTIATTAAVVGRCCRLPAADSAPSGPRGLELATATSQPPSLQRNGRQIAA